MVLDETTFTLVGEMDLDWFEGVTSLQDLNVLGDFEARPHSKVEFWLVARGAAALCVAGVALGDVHLRFAWQV